MIAHFFKTEVIKFFFFLFRGQHGVGMFFLFFLRETKRKMFLVSLFDELLVYYSRTLLEYSNG